MLEHMSNKLSEYMSNRMFQRVGVSVFLVHCHVYYQKAIEQIDIYIYIYSIYIQYIYIYYSYDDLRWFSWCHQNLPLFQTLPHQRVQVGLPELGRCWEVLEPIAVERGRLSCASESPRGVQEFSLRSLGFRGKFIENMRKCCWTTKGGVLPVFPLTKSGSTLLHF